MEIWAHRGASGEYPENTLLAFEQAIVQGATGIELDVYQLGDELYIYHDRYIKDASGEPHLFAKQSKNWVDNIALPHGQHVPTLTEALTAIRGRCAVNVEVKQLENVELLYRVLCHAIEKYYFRRQQFVISSFDHDFLDAWRCRELFFKMGLLSASTLRYVDIPSLLYSINLSIDCLREADVQRAHEQMLKVYVYTVDKPEDIQRCLDLGVDGVFTNFPARTRKIVNGL